MNQTGSETEVVRVEAMLATGMSYRQLDYWTNQGYLKPVKDKPGSGYNRRWPAAERDVARLIIRLLAVGIELATAARIARAAVETADNRVDLGGGVVISLEDPDPDPEPEGADA